MLPLLYRSPLWLKLRPLFLSPHSLLSANCLFISLMGATHVLILRWSCPFIDSFILWPNCRMCVFTPLSQGKWLSCSLSRAQLRPLMIDLMLMTLKIYSKPICQRTWHFLPHTTSFLLMRLLSDLTAYCPSGAVLCLYLGKTLASTCFAFSEFLNHSHISFSAYCHILIMYICPQTPLNQTETYTFQDLPFLTNSTWLKTTRPDADWSRM